MAAVRRSLLDNVEMSLAKTDARIARRYLALGDRPDLADLVLEEHALTTRWVLAVTGHERLLEGAGSWAGRSSSATRTSTRCRTSSCARSGLCGPNATSPTARPNACGASCC